MNESRNAAPAVGEYAWLLAELAANAQLGDVLDGQARDAITTLLARLAEAERERNRAKNTLSLHAGDVMSLDNEVLSMRQQRNEAEASLRAANSRIERLEKALRPQAADAENFPPTMRDDQVVAVQLGHLRCAREALAVASGTGT